MANICLDRNAIYILYVKKNNSILTIENAYVYVNDVYRTLLRNIEMLHMSLCPNQHSDDTHVTGIYMFKPEPYFSF